MKQIQGPSQVRAGRSTSEGAKGEPGRTPAPPSGSVSGNLSSRRWVPIDAQPERLERITVCTRPFRAAGPRIEAERIGGKLVVHNYGHGGSGWSLSWGSAALVVPIALGEGVQGAGAREIAVVGCGAMGLTSALALQQSGAKVTIYAREMPPAVRSSRATGLWSPDSRVGLAQATDAAFAARWEDMARRGWARFRELESGPGDAVTMHDRFELSDLPPDEAIAERYRKDPVGFAHLEGRVSDLYPPHRDSGPGAHPFGTGFCRFERTLRFNISTLSELLIAQFRQRGGVLRQAEFQTPNELARLPAAAIVNCTGYGARVLFGDTSLTPVRGQIGWLPPQPEANYSLQWNKLSVVSRGDGVVVQLGASSDGTGWNDASEEPDPSESETAVRALAALQRRVQV